MNLQNLLNQFIGSSSAAPSSDNAAQNIGSTLSKLTSSIPGGLAGGAAAGGIMALLLSNKTARKFAGNAAAYGGAAILGGLAYKAFKNRQQNSSDLTTSGQINNTEQQRIFGAVEQLEFSAEMKGTMFDLLRQPISVEDIARGIDNIEQKSGLYLASCLVINPDHPSEQAHLDQLASVLELPQGLTQQIQRQAQQAATEAA